MTIVALKSSYNGAFSGLIMASPCSCRCCLGTEKHQLRQAGHCLNYAALQHTLSNLLTDRMLLVLLGSVSEAATQAQGVDRAHSQAV